jgi:TRAP-type transport system periplasmic protein
MLDFNKPNPSLPAKPYPEEAMSVRSVEKPKRHNTQSARRIVRWVLAHEPPVVFEEASREFMELLREKTNGDLQAELIQADDFAKTRGQEFVGRTELVELVQSGEIDMAHCYVAAVGTFHDPLWAIELPFLFQNYDHAERVFEGPAAGKLMNGMEPLGLRGIAFAYSGGYRIVATKDRPLWSLSDYQGLRLRTAGNPVPEALYESLGGSAVGAPLEAIPGMVDENLIDGCEITWVRFNALGLDKVFNVVNETSHSLFTTITVANDAWFKSMPENHQVAIMEAGQMACRTERKTAIQEEIRTRDNSKLMRVQMEKDSHKQLKEAGLAIHDRFLNRFGEDLVASIRDA